MQHIRFMVVATATTFVATTLGVISPVPAVAASTVCTQVNSTWWSTESFPYENPPDLVVHHPLADPSDLHQTHDLEYQACATRTNSTTISVAWNWHLYNGATDEDSVVSLYTFNCSTNKASTAKATMEYANGTSLLFGSGIKTFTVTAGTKYKVGFAGVGDLRDTRYAYQTRFDSYTPSPIIPFRGRTTCT